MAAAVKAKGVLAGIVIDVDSPVSVGSLFVRGVTTGHVSGGTTLPT